MSRRSTYELILRRARDYLNARTRKGKGLILDEMEKTTGYDRKTLIRLFNMAKLNPEKLRCILKGKPISKKGRPRKYDSQIGLLLWRIADEGSVRTSPILFVSDLRENMDKFIQKGIIPRDQALIKQLLSLSPSTAYRLLRSAESTMGPISRTKPYPKTHKSLRARIPFAIATERDGEPGHLQADTCEHSGGFHEGRYIHSLTITDIRTGWTLLSANLGLRADDFKELISKCLSRYPVKVRTFQTDGGPEFLNNILEDYTRRRGIRLIASRPYKSNDQAHVEERHNHVVRAFVGRDRLETQAELDVLLDIYENLELLLNLFTSTRRSMGRVRTRTGRLRSVYDKPQTPLKRLLPYLHENVAQELLELRDGLNPVDLKREIRRLQRLLGELVSERRRRGS